MNPVHTADCDVVYKGPNEQIGDLWCHRIRPGLIRVTFEPTEEELELLKAGGRVQLSIWHEPISPISMGVVAKEESEPVAPHGFKIDKNPGDKLENEEENNGEKENTSIENHEGDLSRSQNGSETLGEAADTVSS